MIEASPGISGAAKTSKADPSKDRNVFASLVRAIKADIVVVSVKAARLNYPGSPVWDPGENIAPLLAMFAVSAVLSFTVHLLVGAAMLVLSMLIYVIAIRPWILQRVSNRALEAALKNIHNWDLLWRKGGLTVALKSGPRTPCQSPSGDWRAFIKRCVPDVNVSGTELYRSFARNEDGEANAEASTANAGIPN